MMVRVTYGTNPGCILLAPGPGDARIILWDRADAERLALDLCEALRKAWPDRPPA